MSSPYKSGPRKVNVVSILFYGAIIFGIYAGVRFLPPYWTQWQVKEKLRDACAAMYQMQKYEPAVKATEMQKLQDRIYNDVKGMGIEDPDMLVELDDSVEGWVIARSSYRVTVTHPVGKPTIMHFTPEARMDTAPTTDKKK
jgi:hypothetical protein